jgi:hypothetical protein
MVSVFSIASGSAETIWGLRGAGNANAILSCPVRYCTVRQEPFPFPWLRRSVFATGIYTHCIAGGRYIRP